jgi:hypothetical protein
LEEEATLRLVLIKSFYWHNLSTHFYKTCIRMLYTESSLSAITCCLPHGPRVVKIMEFLSEAKLDTLHRHVSAMFQYLSL